MRYSNQAHRREQHDARMSRMRRHRIDAYFDLHKIRFKNATTLTRQVRKGHLDIYMPMNDEEGKKYHSEVSLTMAKYKVYNEVKDIDWDGLPCPFIVRLNLVNVYNRVRSKNRQEFDDAVATIVQDLHDILTDYRSLWRVKWFSWGYSKVNYQGYVLVALRHADPLLEILL